MRILSLNRAALLGVGLLGVLNVTAAGAQECAGVPLFRGNVWVVGEASRTGGGSLAGARLRYGLSQDLIVGLNAGRVRTESILTWRYDETGSATQQTVQVDPGFQAGADVGFEAFAHGLPVCFTVGVQHARFPDSPPAEPSHFLQTMPDPTLFFVQSDAGRSFYPGGPLLVNPSAGFQVLMVRGQEDYLLTVYPDASVHARLGLGVGPLRAVLQARRWISDDPVFATPVKFHLGPYSLEEGRSAVVFTLQAGVVF